MCCDCDCSDSKDPAWIAFTRIKVSLAKNNGLTYEVLSILRDLVEKVEAEITETDSNDQY